MAAYCIFYDSGETEIIPAESVEYEHGDGMFNMKDADGQLCAWVPAINVRSVRRVSE